MAVNLKSGGKLHSGTGLTSSPSRRPVTSRARMALSASEVVFLRQDKRLTIEKTRAAKS